MSNHIYRLIALYQSVDDAIHAELKLPDPSGLRLLRLKKLKAAIKGRLKPARASIPQAV